MAWHSPTAIARWRSSARLSAKPLLTNLATAVTSAESGWLLVAASMPLVFAPWSANAFELPKATLLRAVALCMLLAAVLRVRSLPNLRHMPAIGWAVPALAAAYGLATLFSVQPVESLWGSYERQQGLLTILAYLVICAVTAAGLRTPAQARRLAGVIVWGGLPVIAYGLVQAAQLDPFAFSRQSDSASPVTAMLGRSNFVGSYLVLVTSLTAAMAATSRHRVAYALLGAAQLVCLVLVQARSAWLGLLAAAIVGAAWYWPRMRRDAIRLGAVLAALLLFAAALGTLPGAPAPTNSLGTLVRLDEGSAAARLTIWNTTLPLIGQRPWLGYGPETLRAVFTPVYPPQLVYYLGRQTAVDRAHNLWLDTALSSGVIGLVALIALLLAAGRAILRGQSAGNTPAERALRAAVAGALAGHLVDLQFAFDLTATAALFWLLLALGAALGRGLRAETAAAERPPTHLPVLAYLPAVALIALLIYAACVRPLVADAVSAQSLNTGLSIEQRTALAEEAVRIWPLETEYSYRLINLYALGGRTADLERAMAALMPRLAEPSRWWALRGDYYAVRGGRNPAMLTEAAAAYRQAVAAAPNVAAYHGALGAALLRLEQIADGVAALERATALDATDATSFRLLADAYARQGRPGDAARAMQEAIRWSGH